MLFFLTDKQFQCWYFDQAVSGVKTNLPGFCAGMVIAWITLRRRGEDFEIDYDGKLDAPVARVSEDVVRQILDFQDAFEVRSGRTTYDKLLSAFDLRVPKAIRISANDGEFEDARLEEIADTVSALAEERLTSDGPADPSAWFLMRLRPPSGSGHVVAIEVAQTKTGQVFRLMDPSNGCFVFPSLMAFKNWLLHLFFNKTGYRVLYTGCVKLHPIDPVAPTVIESVMSFFQNWKNPFQ